MRSAPLALLAVPLCLTCLPLAAQPKPAEDPAHDELRALKAGVTGAIERGDVDGLLAFLAPDVVVTWQNAEVSRGRDAVKAYYDRMMKGPGAIVKRFKTDVTVDALTILYSGGTAGVSYGSSADTFELASGTSFTLKSRWSATLVKPEGRWLIASFHASTNLFDNPLLNAAKGWLFRGIAISLAVGLLIGFLVGRSRGRATGRTP